MRTILAGLILSLAGCGGSNGVCQPKAAPSGQPCASGVLEKSVTTGCTDETGAAFVCRNGSGFCKVCTGDAFENGCTLPTTTSGASYCVHACSDC